MDDNNAQKERTNLGDAKALGDMKTPIIIIIIIKMKREDF